MSSVSDGWPTVPQARRAIGVAVLMKELLTIRQVMTAKPRTLTCDVSILDAVDFLLRHDVPSVPVVDAGGHLVGVLSEKDCLRLVAEGDAAAHDVPSGTVEAFMTRDVVTLPPGMDVCYAAGRFLEQPYRRYPVVENGRLLGEVSRRDVMRACLGTLRAAQWEAAADGA